MIKNVLLLSIILCSAGLKAGQLQQIDPQGDSAYEAPESIAPTAFTVKLPHINLVDHRNQSVALQSLFADENNVVFAFFFTHCVSVCTTITLSLKSLQQDLPPDTLIAMISIDPDNDTPELLSAYAKQHQIDDRNWYLLTGDSRQIVRLQKDFEAYRGNKMNHSISLFVKKTDSAMVTEFKNNFIEIPTFLKTSKSGV